ncbi:citrate lyase beta chain [Renibacterium salmoninarum ATCC 33209]|uniref:Citrate lyase beta chain n=1 Tax=Renibacterium salmoninarum (strain ATCC 33209 / DSM 20767 / JCM 11484 / NBRC 15589 / NCIMB 2235) TaxID=288705 RepID=A9WL36_RENSM|nr:CoA ester lyase [Renibacterium salmoninarum]ABY22305.1 citrate lyase beta chain [Renibacterium salmoninarum ATCC 33209]
MNQFADTLLTMGPAILFCPADRPERYAKALERADAVILDLEDAVAPDAKAQARKFLLENPLDPARTIVRINAAGTSDFALDLDAVSQSAYRTVMLAKAESAEQLRIIADHGVQPRASIRVIALCETALGVLRAAEIAQEPNVVGLMWGAEDLVASLGGSSSRFADGRYRAVALQARSQVLLAAGAFGKDAVDAVYLDIPDVDGLAAEVNDAVASGFTATACIHPSQVAVISAGYAPSATQVADAEELLTAAAQAGNGVFQFKGQMIDGPVLKHAEQVLRRAH